MLTACGKTSPDHTLLLRDAHLLATLQCEARALLETRISLANDIRFAEDSLLRTPADAAEKDRLKARLDTLRASIPDVSVRTRILADSISQTLARLHEARYPTAADRLRLDSTQLMLYQSVCPE
jgi:hypothetical protein